MYACRKLRNNAFSGVLNMTGDAIGSELQLIDLENNEISSVDLGDPGYSNTLMFVTILELNYPPLLLIM